ncbi:MAG: hypothetical protein GXO26_01770 [Crenarchaeota archaeon]|nr:hypothetical protein [Thermoproteota archaeon]
MSFFWSSYGKYLDVLEYPIAVLGEEFYPSKIVMTSTIPPIFFVLEKQIPKILESYVAESPIFYIANMLELEHRRPLYVEKEHVEPSIILEKAARKILETYRKNLPVKEAHYITRLEPPTLNTYVLLTNPLTIYLNRRLLSIERKGKTVVRPLEDIIIMVEPLNPETLRNISFKSLCKVFDSYIDLLVDYLKNLKSYLIYY